MSNNSNSNSNNDENISMLMSMGFDLSQSQRALLQNNGNLERAIDFLLSGGADALDSGRGSGDGGNEGGGTTTVSSATTTTTIVQSTTSQYTNPLGRSACTCISLTMAQNFLKSINNTDCSRHYAQQEQQQQQQQQQHHYHDVVTSTFLENCILEGIQKYSTLLLNNDNVSSNHNNSSSVEHSSVEEILMMTQQANNNSSNSNSNNSPLSSFASLQLLENSPRQGILDSHPSTVDRMNNPIGLSSLLCQCQADAGISSNNSKNNYVAVVITKPPETVLVLLPTKTSSRAATSSVTTTTTTNNDNNNDDDDSSSMPYILLDSHPRPDQLSPHYPQGSYALLHSNMMDLVTSLKQIFPVVELGNDVPEMMAMMYNSFDVYPFRWNQVVEK